MDNYWSNLYTNKISIKYLIAAIKDWVYNISNEDSLGKYVIQEFFFINWQFKIIIIEATIRSRNWLFRIRFILNNICLQMHAVQGNDNKS